MNSELQNQISSSKNQEDQASEKIARRTFLIKFFNDIFNFFSDKLQRIRNSSFFNPNQSINVSGQYEPEKQPESQHKSVNQTENGTQTDQSSFKEETKENFEEISSESSIKISKYSDNSTQTDDIIPNESVAKDTQTDFQNDDNKICNTSIETNLKQVFLVNEKQNKLTLSSVQEEKNLKLITKPTKHSFLSHVLPPFGFENIGNSCYMNSVLQCFLQIPEFVELIANFKGQEGSLLQALRSLHEEMKAENGSTYQRKFFRENLHLIKESISNFDESFSDYSQKDAVDLILTIIATLTSELDLEKSEFFQKLFNFERNDSFRCPYCKVTSDLPSDLLNVLVFPIASKSLQDCLGQYMKSLSYCGCCKKSEEMIFKSKFEKCGDYLIIKLDRSGLDYAKSSYIDVSVDIESQIDLSNYYSKTRKYKLISYINHYGYLSGGHYTSVVFSKTKNCWIKCNDQNITMLSNGSFKDQAYYGSSNPIVLFYKCCEA